MIEISSGITALLADVFALDIKTKNFLWHMSGSQFRHYHLLLDQHGDQLFGITDDVAERVRNIAGTTLRSIRHIAVRGTPAWFIAGQLISGLLPAQDFERLAKIATHV